MMDKNQLEQEFHKAMLNIYQEALNLPQPYKATRFLQIVNEFGGKKAADKLLSTGEKKTQTGFTELILSGGGVHALKYSMEYLVLQKPWCDLFTEEQLAVARKRLERVGFVFPK